MMLIEKCTRSNKPGLFIFFLLCWVTLHGQRGVSSSVVDWAQRQWNANWITTPDESKYNYGVFHFRKQFHISSIPQSFVIHVSADPRYELFVNGKRVCRGPARGSLHEWFYETIDLAPFLREGENLITATVWNQGEWAPGAQVSLYTALIIQGKTEDAFVVNTDGSWKFRENLSYTPSLSYLQDVGAAEVIQGEKYPWDWQQISSDESDWREVTVKEKGQPKGTGTQCLRALSPRPIPQMERKLEEPLKIRRCSMANTALSRKFPLRFPAHSKVSILFDRGYLTNAYLSYSISKGKGAKVSITYAEALYADDNNKGNRDSIEGKHMKGYVDILYPEGGMDRIYSPLWFRTYRYLQIDVETAEEELLLNSIGSEYTGYPFEEKGYFSCSDTSLHKVWEVGWRTARLCAGETYYDCPYYEQLQYVGDTRIQSLISLYVSGDDRLMRKAIADIASSVMPEGLLLSRYPARYNQVIPPFSLYWINMLHDYWMHRGDVAFVKSYLPIVKLILSWFEAKMDSSTGMLGALSYWNFVDWTKEWPWSDVEAVGGVPPGALTGGSSVLTLQLSYALTDAIALCLSLGEQEVADKYSQWKSAMNHATVNYCFHPEKQLMADDIAHTSFSQHASIMGILSGAISESNQRDVFLNMMSDPTLIQASVYYRFYLFRAMKKVGMADEYLNHLYTWKEMLQNGLTTFAEQPEPSRSDCHAWSASPNYDFLSIVCGIEPASPGFGTVAVAPSLGYLSHVKGGIPHPAGKIEVGFRKYGNRLSGNITLPDGVYGTYYYRGRTQSLLPGDNIIGE